MREIAVIMKKGGVAKTTTAVSIASCAAAMGVDVGLIDLDSQASATRALGLEPGDDAAEVLLGETDLASAWQDTEFGVRVIASNPSTESAERQLAADAIEGLTALRRAIAGAGSDRPEVIIVDTRPDEAHGTLNALVAAREVWITAEPVPASIEVFPRLISTIDRIESSLNPGLTLTAIIPTSGSTPDLSPQGRSQGAPTDLRGRGDPARADVGSGHGSSRGGSATRSL